jgi:hypothetical protein
MLLCNNQVAKQGEILNGHRFQIIDTESNRIASLKEKETRSKAISVALTITEVGEMMMYLVMLKAQGIGGLENYNLTKADEIDIKNKFYDVINSSPEKFIALHNDTRTKNRYLIERAAMHNIIQKRANNKFAYGQELLGTADEAIVWLQEAVNEVSATIIKEQLKDIDATLIMENNNKVKEVENPTPVESRAKKTK